jgi:hypothetical protein
VSAKLSCLMSASVLLASAAAFGQAAVQIGPAGTGTQVQGPSGSAISVAPLGTQLAPGPSVPSFSGLGTPGTGGTLIAPGPAGSVLSPIQNLPVQALIPPGCPGSGFATAPLTLGSIFPLDANLATFTPIIPFDRAIGC